MPFLRTNAAYLNLWESFKKLYFPSNPDHLLHPVKTRPCTFSLQWNKQPSWYTIQNTNIILTRQDWILPWEAAPHHPKNVNSNNIWRQLPWQRGRILYFTWILVAHSVPRQRDSAYAHPHKGQQQWPNQFNQRAQVHNGHHKLLCITAHHNQDKDNRYPHPLLLNLADYASTLPPRTVARYAAAP